MDESFVEAVYGGKLSQSDASRRNAEFTQLTEAQLQKIREEEEAMAELIGDDGKANDGRDVDPALQQRKRR